MKKILNYEITNYKKVIDKIDVLYIMSIYNIKMRFTEGGNHDYHN